MSMLAANHVLIQENVHWWIELGDNRPYVPTYAIGEL